MYQVGKEIKRISHQLLHTVMSGPQLKHRMSTSSSLELHISYSTNPTTFIM